MPAAAKKKPAKQVAKTEPPRTVESRTPPAQPLESIAAAAAGPYLIAVWRLEAGKLVLDRYAKDFLNGDFPIAVDMLRKNLGDEAPWEFK